MGYNPTGNDPIRHNRVARRRRDRRINSSLTAVGTQPFRAVDKLKRQIELIQKLQDAIEQVISSVQAVVINDVNVTDASAGYTSWTTIASIQVNRPANTTKVTINAVAQAVFTQSISSDGITSDDLKAAREARVYIRILIDGQQTTSMEAAKSGSGDSYIYTVTTSGLGQNAAAPATSTITLQVMSTSTIGFEADDQAYISAYATYQA